MSPIVHFTVFYNDTMRKIGLCLGVSEIEVSRMLRAVFPETRYSTIVGFQYDSDFVSLSEVCANPHLLGDSPTVNMLTDAEVDAALNTSGDSVATDNSALSGESNRSLDDNSQASFSSNGSQVGTIMNEDEAVVLEMLVRREDPRVIAAFEAFPELQKMIDAFMRMASYTVAQQQRQAEMADSLLVATLADAPEEDQVAFRETLTYMVDNQLLTEREMVALQMFSAAEHPALVSILKRYLANKDRAQLMKALSSISQHAMEAQEGTGYTTDSDAGNDDGNDNQSDSEDLRVSDVDQSGDESEALSGSEGRSVPSSLNVTQDKDGDSQVSDDGEHRLRLRGALLTHIESLVERGLLPVAAASQLSMLAIAEHPLVISAFLAYAFNKDEMDLLDTFVRILRKVIDAESEVSETVSEQFQSDRSELSDTAPQTVEESLSARLSPEEFAVVKTLDGDLVLGAALTMYAEDHDIDEFRDTLLKRSQAVMRDLNSSFGSELDANSDANSEAPVSSDAAPDGAAEPAQVFSVGSQNVTKEFQLVAVLREGNVLTELEANAIKHMILKDDDVVMAAFELGRATEDWDELYDTLVRVLRTRGILEEDVSRAVVLEDSASAASSDGVERVLSITHQALKELFDEKKLTLGQLGGYEPSITMANALLSDAQANRAIYAALEILNIDDNFPNFKDTVHAIVSVDSYDYRLDSNENSDMDGETQ
jgi:hypothetical protein